MEIITVDIYICSYITDLITGIPDIQDLVLTSQNSIIDATIDDIKNVISDL